jgi:hypothetical protein
MAMKKMVVRVGDTVYANVVIFRDGTMQIYTFTEMNRAADNYHLLCEKAKNSGYIIEKVIQCTSELKY